MDWLKQIAPTVASALGGGTIYLVTKIFPSQQDKIDQLIDKASAERKAILDECKEERALLAAEAKAEAAGWEAGRTGCLLVSRSHKRVRAASRSPAGAVNSRNRRCSPWRSTSAAVPSSSRPTRNQFRFFIRVSATVDSL